MGSFGGAQKLTDGQTNVIQLIEGVDEEVELYAACQTIIDIYGYQYFSVLRYPEDYYHNLYDLVLASNWPASLIKMYDQSFLLKQSAFASNIRETRRPFLWTAREMYDAKSDEPAVAGRYLFEKSGMSHGVGFPVTNPDEARGFVFLTGDRDLKNEARFDELKQISSSLFNKVLKLQQKLPKPDSKLSKREHECLLWTSEGKTSYEIGMILGLSENTINNYLVTVGRKLGAVNRPHMVGIALRRGYI